ncbi:MAG: hypothetical protein JST40_13580 [Armatimonadetes bacterium]|nr:hypothetical protein [Armatimonadota bacterium]
MNPKKSKFFPFFATSSLLAAVIGGAFVRHHLEYGTETKMLASLDRDTLLASADSQAQIPETDYYTQVVDRLKNTYVEHVADEQALAIGAVRGMVDYLDDPLANYMSKEQFKAFAASQSGTFEGIGVELRFQFNKVRERKKIENSGEGTAEPTDIADFIPNLVVSGVAPGSPAAKAGILPGDRIDSVAGKWLLSTEEIKTYRDENKKVRESKLTDEEMDKKLRALRDKAENALMPAKARDLLTLGTTGNIAVGWKRGGRSMSAEISKATTQWKAVEREGDAINIKLFDGAADQLKPLIKEGSSLTIDLRNSTLGNFPEMKRVFNLLAPKGEYGAFVAETTKRPVPLLSQGTGPKLASITLLVDSTTRGAAEVMAKALTDHGLAKLKGSDMAGENAEIKVVALADGSGYTLPTGYYKKDLPLEAKK